MSAIFFKPWIGDDYQAGKRFGKRVMILGEAREPKLGATPSPMAARAWPTASAIPRRGSPAARGNLTSSRRSAVPERLQRPRSRNIAESELAPQ